jgi:DMSO/TMAO reductase YedYZ molybdopterin-dependent catalytic subunit
VRLALALKLEADGELHLASSSTGSGGLCQYTKDAGSRIEGERIPVVAEVHIVKDVEGGYPELQPLRFSPRHLDGLVARRLRAWQMRLRTSQAKTTLLGIPDLELRSRSMGRHLMECSGNSREARFGMLSVADWAGVPMGTLLDRLGTLSGSSRILVSGFDHYPQASASAVEGASWIFTTDQLQSSGAFLALEMNGEALKKVHGAPVRLLMPGWYGCSSIKWVNEISVVAADAPATSQMQEFASRTHQQGVPKLARDFRPAVIQEGAMPVRVEKWTVLGNIKYRVVGILWGGSEPVKALQNRCNPEEDYVAVDTFSETPNDPWSFWSHVGTPKAPGTYAMRLRVSEPVMAAKRLGAGFFVRSVEISEV